MVVEKSQSMPKSKVEPSDLETELRLGGGNL